MTAISAYIGLFISGGEMIGRKCPDTINTNTSINTTKQAE